jgi:hypothetical protein
MLVKGANETDHFHVHIVNANQAGMMGMSVGQAHLLDDIISLVGLLQISATDYAPTSLGHP